MGQSAESVREENKNKLKDEHLKKAIRLVHSKHPLKDEPLKKVFPQLWWWGSIVTANGWDEFQLDENEKIRQKAAQNKAAQNQQPRHIIDSQHSVAMKQPA